MSQGEAVRRIREIESRLSMLEVTLGTTRAGVVQLAQNGELFQQAGFNDSSGVFFDPTCSVALPATLLCSFAWGVALEFQAQMDLDWDGQEWTGCAVIQYPGPPDWQFIGGFWQVVGYLGAFACMTPVQFTLTPPGIPPAYILTGSQLVAQNPQNLILEVRNTPGTIIQHIPVPVYPAVAGACGAAFNSTVVSQVVSLTCSPWFVQGAPIFDGNLIIDNGKPLIQRGQPYGGPPASGGSIAISIPP